MKNKDHYAQKGWHKLYDIDIPNRMAVCAVCGLVQVTLVNKSKRQNKMWTCVTIARRRRTGANYGYVQFRKSTCERCGFVPEHIGQLDVHHIDGNHDNNDPANLRTLCANCHRLTYCL